MAALLEAACLALVWELFWTPDAALVLVVGLADEGRLGVVGLGEAVRVVCLGDFAFVDALPSDADFLGWVG